MRKLLRDYRAYVTGQGYPPNLMATGYFFSIVAAYSAFDGDHWSANDLATQTFTGLMVQLASRPALAHMNNATLARINDDLALTGATLLYVASEARAQHDGAALARIRRQARAFLVTYHHLDPQRTRLDDTYCMANAWILTAPCNESKWIATGGKVGQNPFQLPIVGR